MKQRIGAIVGAGYAAVLMIFVFLPAQKAQAADCEDISDYGAVRLFVPELSTDQQYALWLRLQTTDSQARLLVQRETGECLDITAIPPAADQWFWHRYETNGAMQLLTFSEPTANSLLLIGVQAGLRVDKVMLTKPGCIPEDLGSNCRSSVEAVSFNHNEVTMIQPPSADTVSGRISLSQTPTTVQGSLKELRYVVGGRTLQKSPYVESFDTTLVKNGKHTVYLEMELIDGTLIREATIIDINNPEHALSPLIRWLRLNQEVVVLTGLGVAGIIILLLLIGGLKSWLIKRRQFHFHGF